MRVPIAPLVALVGIALALTGCIRDPDPFSIEDDNVSIHFILESGADSVIALITMASPIGTGSTVNDADVRLIAGVDTIPLSFEGEDDMTCAEAWPPSFGARGHCYRADLTTPIGPGETYDLEVILADGARITGRTTVPLPVTLSSPTTGEVIIAECNDPTYCYGLPSQTPPYTIPLAEVAFRWAQTVQPSRVGVGMRPVRVFSGGEEHPGFVCGVGFFNPRVGADSATLAIPNIGCGEPLGPARFDSIQIETVVHVRNGEYGRYLEVISEGQTARAAAVSEGLEGPAWGVFGAIAAARRTVMIVRNPPPE